MNKIKKEDYDNLIKWFESVYKGNVINVEIKNNDGSYRCNLVFFKDKDLIDSYLKHKARGLLKN